MFELEKKTENKNPEVAKTKNRRISLYQMSSLRLQKSKFIKQQKASGLLSSLGIEKPLSKFL